MISLSSSFLAQGIARALNIKRGDAKDEHGPDLVVDAVDASDSNPVPGESVWFDVTVRNQGDRDAAAFNVRISSDDLDEKERIKGLSAGAKHTLQHMGPLQIQEGHDLYWVDATADCDNEIVETRKDNNDLIVSVMPAQEPEPPVPPEPPIPPIPPHRTPRTLLAD